MDTSGYKTKFTVDKENLQVLTERMFNASVELVYKAFTDKELIPKWWGPAYLKTTIDKLELNEGGTWRFIQIEQSGNEYAFHGIYKKIIPNQKITWTFNFEPIGPGHEILETVTFEDVDGKTNVKTVSQFNTIEDLEGMVQSGMEKGLSEGHSRLDEVLPTL